MAMHLNEVPNAAFNRFSRCHGEPEDKYRSIQPDETIHFTWTANYLVYLCITVDTNGFDAYDLWYGGMLIVEPKEGYPAKQTVNLPLFRMNTTLKTGRCLHSGYNISTLETAKLCNF
jgi:hypothetical protein